MQEPLLQPQLSQPLAQQPVLVPVCLAVALLLQVPFTFRAQQSELLRTKPYPALSQRRLHFQAVVCLVVFELSSCARSTALFTVLPCRPLLFRPNGCAWTRNRRSRCRYRKRSPKLRRLPGGLRPGRLRGCVSSYFLALRSRLLHARRTAVTWNRVACWGTSPITRVGFDAGYANQGRSLTPLCFALAANCRPC